MPHKTNQTITAKVKVLKKDTPVRINVTKARTFSGTGIGVIEGREPPYYFVKLAKPVLAIRYRYANIMMAKQSVIAMVRRGEIEELNKDEYEGLKDKLLKDALEKERRYICDSRSFAQALQRIVSWYPFEESQDTALVMRRV